MAGHSSLSDIIDTQVEIAPISLAGAGGPTNGLGVDMAGWEGVLFTVAIGAMTGLGALDGYAQSSPTSKTSNDMANISGSALTQIAATSNTNVAQISIYRPTQRYVRCVLNQTVNTVVAGVTAQRFRRTGLNPGANIGQPSQTPIQVVKVVQN